MTLTVQSRSTSPTMRVFAYASGHLAFIEGPMTEGTAALSGALIVATGPKDIVEPTVKGLARLAYDNETYLVPGCPEADGDEDAAYKALVTWFERVNTALKRKGCSRLTGQETNEAPAPREPEHREEGPLCGLCNRGRMTWCSTCRRWSSTCCQEYGTCQCS